MTMGCGQGGDCCGSCSQFKGIEGYYPNIEGVLWEYVQQKLNAGEPFYLSPEVNSDVANAPTPPGFGFIAALVAGIASLAATIGPTVTAVASVAAMAKSSGGGGAASSSAQVTAQDIANAVTPAVAAKLQAQGVTLPQGLATDVTKAGIADVFGTNTKPIMIAAAVGIVALLLLKRR